MSHAELEQLAAGYVLGALEPDDEQVFGRHLAGCQPCQADVEQLRAVVGELAFAVPQVEPPKALRESIRREIGLTKRRRGLFAPRAPAARPAQVPTGGPATPRRSFFPRVAAGFALAAIMALGFWNFSLQNQIELEQARQQQIAAAMRVAANPDAERVTLAAAGPGQGRATLVVVENTAEAALLVEGMPELPEGRVWQFWTVPPGAGPEAAIPGPTWESGTQAAAVPLGRLPLVQEAAFAVTQEPGPSGSEHPTSEIVIQGTAATA